MWDTDNYLTILNIIVTIFLGIGGFWLNNKINSINTNITFYNKIFDEILIDKLPVAVDEAIKNNFLNFDKLDDTLVELDKKILYLKVKNYKFYSEVSEQILVIDDFLSHIYNTKIKSGNTKKLEKEIETLYRIIYKNYNK